jgi:hypothetical protein
VPRADGSPGWRATRSCAAQLAELRELNARIAALTADDDAGSRSHRYLAMNREFHARIHRMSAAARVAMEKHILATVGIIWGEASPGGTPRDAAGLLAERQ